MKRRSSGEKEYILYKIKYQIKSQEQIIEMKNEIKLSATNCVERKTTRVVFDCTVIDV